MSIDKDAINRRIAELNGWTYHPIISRAKAAIKMGGSVMFDNWPCGCTRRKVQIALATHCHDDKGVACQWGWNPEGDLNHTKLAWDKLTPELQDKVEQSLSDPQNYYFCLRNVLADDGALKLCTAILAVGGSDNE